ncbi:hypothetical protein PQX77_002756 [Marasmius sp. AFHP31]|nr:hypothetical protein PQX77_002756 [Marasmius sp. AFHP31]
MSRSLVDALRGRLEHGAPVKRVKLKDCKNLYGNEIERLKVDLGPSIEIDWDRVETDGIYSDGAFDSEDSDDSSNAWLVGWWFT